MASSDKSTELIDIVCEYLDAGKFKEALELPNDNKYADALKAYSWDLIPQLLNRIQDDTIIRWPALQRCCERLLLEIADRANPEEVLLELIEQTEGAKNDAQFIAILLPLQNVLKRLINKRGRSLEWCSNAIYSYIEALPLPEDYDFSDQENLLIDCDANARRIVKIYSELPIFYAHFIKEAIKNQEKNPSAKKILLCFLIDLLGRPIALLDMTHNKTKSHCRVLVENIFKDISTLEPNLFIFIQYVYRKCHPKTDNSLEGGVYEDAPTDIFLLEEKLKPVSLGVLYYLLLVEKQPVTLLPQVYSSMYVSQELLYLSVCLLQQEENMLRQKGLQLAQALIDLLPDVAPSSLLSSSSHPTLAKILCTTAVYCPAEPLRKLAVVIIKNYILKFDNKGRYLFIVNLLPSLKHSGIKGYVISLYKEALMNAYQQGAEALICFSGYRLRAVLSMACHLAEGAETNLVESADQIISALNLLRFLVLRDTDNITEIWDSIQNIQETFLSPLRNGLDLSRAHYEAKLFELDNGVSEDKTDSSPVSVSVNGSLLDNLSPEKKKEVVNAGINALHLIDSVLCRLQECINAPHQVIKNGQQRFVPILMQSACLSTKQIIEELPQEDSSSDDEKSYIEDVKIKILKASMEFVKEEGWTREALARGAKSVGYASTVHSIFPHGPAHLVYFFTLDCNNNLAKQMEKKVSDKTSDLVKPATFIENSILTRIQMIEPYKSNWNSALATVINSKLALDQATALLKLADDICYFAGDRSVDSTWYARRAVVAGVYQASELYWLGGGKDTQTFAAKQLQAAVNLEGIPKNISALLTVIRNILPINLNR